jgi:hypothetical protein
MRTGQAQLQILCRPMVAQGGGHQFAILPAFYSGPPKLMEVLPVSSYLTTKINSLRTVALIEHEVEFFGTVSIKR